MQAQRRKQVSFLQTNSLCANPPIAHIPMKFKLIYNLLTLDRAFPHVFTLLGEVEIHAPC